MPRLFAPHAGTSLAFAPFLYMCDLSTTYQVEYDGKWYTVYRTHEDTYEVWDENYNVTFEVDKLDVTNGEIDIG